MRAQTPTHTQTRTRGSRRRRPRTEWSHCSRPHKVHRGLKVGAAGSKFDESLRNARRSRRPSIGFLTSCLCEAAVAAPSASWRAHRPWPKRRDGRTGSRTQATLPLPEKSGGTKVTPASSRCRPDRVENGRGYLRRRPLRLRLTKCHRAKIARVCRNGWTIPSSTTDVSTRSWFGSFCPTGSGPASALLPFGL